MQKSFALCGVVLLQCGLPYRFSELTESIAKLTLHVNHKMKFDYEKTLKLKLTVIIMVSLDKGALDSGAFTGSWFLTRENAGSRTRKTVRCGFEVKTKPKM